MKAISMLFGVAAAAVLLAGCSPKLARTPLGEREEKWQEEINRSYPSWKPPKTTPPAIVDNMNPDYAAGKQPATSPEYTEPEEPTSEDFEKVLKEISERNRAGESEEVIVVDEAVTVETAAPPEEAPAPTTPEAGEAQEYVVVAGDTLSGIAKKFYKDGNLYLKIYEANREVLSNPNVLRPGTKLKIPVL